mmetsp:Transcript_40290/g.79575  ORF Transcript_40290/g.79575 Transcript_40290/m.79575 type:complete len:211 (+) Transcript_40290:332-964(+)
MPTIWAFTDGLQTSLKRAPKKRHQLWKHTPVDRKSSACNAMAIRPLGAAYRAFIAGMLTLRNDHLIGWQADEAQQAWPLILPVWFEFTYCMHPSIKPNMPCIFRVLCRRLHKQMKFGKPDATKLTRRHMYRMRETTSATGQDPTERSTWLKILELYFSGTHHFWQLSISCRRQRFQTLLISVDRKGRIQAHYHMQTLRVMLVAFFRRALL